MSEKWNAQMQFPNDTQYINRCVGAEFGASKSSGNPMITLSFELVSPQEVEIAGKMVSITGIKTTTYNSLNITDSDGEQNAEKEAQMKERIKGLYKLFELDTENIDWNNPDVKGFLGKCVYCHMNAEPIEQRKPPTAEQLQEAKRTGKRAEGAVCKNPITGQPVVQYWPKVREIFGLAPTGHVSMAY
jgi:hypothetical protein